MKKPAKRNEVEIFDSVDLELEELARRSKPASKVSRLRKSNSYQQFHWLESGRKKKSPSPSGTADTTVSVPDDVSEYVKQKTSRRGFPKVASTALLQEFRLPPNKPHEPDKTLALKRVTSSPDSHQLLEIEYSREEKRRLKNLPVQGTSGEPDKKKKSEALLCPDHMTVLVNPRQLRRSISFEDQLPDSVPRANEQRANPGSSLTLAEASMQHLQQVAVKRRVQNRPRLKVRRGRRITNHREQGIAEGQAWFRFHQIRDVRTKSNWPGIPPAPVAVPASICMLSPKGNKSRVNAPLQWPTLIPTIFRGPGQYRELHETFIQALRTLRITKEKLPRPKKHDAKRLWLGGFMIPHDDKRYRYGDDSWFASEPLLAFGVCDGVGEMSSTQWRIAGFDCRGFGEDILRGAKARFQTIRTSEKPLLCTRPRMVLPDGRQRCDKQWRNEEFEVCRHTKSPSLMALESLISGFYGKTTTWGAATCLVGCLDERGKKVGFSNIGDSKAIVLRRDQYSTGPLQIVGTTIPEQHGWNLPVQLSRLPDRNRVKSMKDDPRLVRLVKNLDSWRATGQDVSDSVETATLFDFSIREGDLIIIGTDGLWDNVFDEEVAALCGIALSPLESEWMEKSVFMSTSPRDIAKGLCLAAYWKSMQPNCDTPFMQSVRESGGFSSGGKPDDITVIASWVVSSVHDNTLSLLHQCRNERQMKDQKVPCELPAASKDS